MLRGCCLVDVPVEDLRETRRTRAVLTASFSHIPRLLLLLTRLSYEYVKYWEPEGHFLSNRGTHYCYWVIIGIFSDAQVAGNVPKGMAVQNRNFPRIRRSR